MQLGFHLVVILLLLLVTVREKKSFFFWGECNTEKIIIDACIILWKLSLLKETSFGSDYNEYEKETWSVVHMF